MFGAITYDETDEMSRVTNGDRRAFAHHAVEVSEEPRPQMDVPPADIPGTGRGWACYALGSPELLVHPLASPAGEGRETASA